MADDFTRDRLMWLEQVAIDTSLTPTAPRVAILIATRYTNRKTRSAWPSRETLAGDLGVSVPAIGRSIDALQAGGHLDVERARGRGHSNVYRIILKENASVSFSDDKTERPRSLSDAEKVTPTFIKGNAGVHKRERGRSEKVTPTFPEPFEEPIDEPIELNPSRAGAPETIPDELSKPFSDGAVAQYLDPAFDAFWASHPRPISPQKTRAEFDAAVARGVDPHQIAVQAAAYAVQVRTEGRETRFIKGTVNWLIDEGWSDATLPDPRAEPTDPEAEALAYIRAHM